MGKIFSWLIAIACLVGAVIGIGFERPELLPPQIHAQLLARGLANPIKPTSTQATSPGGAARAGAPAQAGGQGGGPRPIAVEAAKIKTQLVTSSLTAVGSLRSDESVVIAAEIEGRIAEVTAKEGVEVQAGEVLFRLDDAMLKADLAQAKAESLLAEANFERADTLYKQRSGTERTRDESKYAVDRTHANVELSTVRLDKATIRAPFDGVLGLRSVSLGKYVTKGESLIVLSRIDPIKVDFRLPEVELASVKVGSKIRMQLDAFLGRTFEGEVTAIDPQVDINGRSISIRAKVGNPGGILKPGLFARIEVVTVSRPNAITVPESALVNQGRDRFVFVVRDGKAARANIRTGVRQPGLVEVVEGLKPDDVVVVSGQQRLREGVLVEIVGTGPTS